jgi:hypothetical protein
MRFGLLILTSLGTVLLLGTRLDAQEIRSPYRFVDESNSGGAYAGYFFGAPGEYGVGPQASPIFGIRYTTRVSGPLVGDLNLSFAPTEREVIRMDTNAGETVATGTMVRMNLLFIEGGMRFHLTGPRTWNGLAPYVTVSGGMATNLAGQPAVHAEIPEDQRFRFGQNFTVGPGFGTDFFLSDRFSLRFEARDHILRMRVPAGLTGTQNAQAIWTNNFAVSLGAALHF